MTKKKSGRLSLHPLEVKQAVAALVATPSPTKRKTARKKSQTRKAQSE
jgi:hypothetical protein